MELCTLTQEMIQVSVRAMKFLTGTRMDTNNSNKRRMVQLDQRRQE